MVLIWSGGPITSFTPVLSSSSPIEADSSMSLLLGKSTEFVLSHLVGCVVEEVQGSMLTAEWPLGVLTYTSELIVSWGIQTVISTSPLLVLFQEAETSGPWIAGGVVRLLQFLYVFSLCHATKYTGSVLFTTLPLFLVFALDFFLG